MTQGLAVLDVHLNGTSRKRDRYWALIFTPGFKHIDVVMISVICEAMGLDMLTMYLWESCMRCTVQYFIGATGANRRKIRDKDGEKDDR